MAATTTTSAATTEAGRRLRDMIHVIEKVSALILRGSIRKAVNMNAGGEEVSQVRFTHNPHHTPPSRPPHSTRHKPTSARPVPAAQPRPQKLQAVPGPGRPLQHRGPAQSRPACACAAAARAGTSSASLGGWGRGKSSLGARTHTLTHARHTHTHPHPHTHTPPPRVEEPATTRRRARYWWS